MTAPPMLAALAALPERRTPAETNRQSSAGSPERTVGAGLDAHQTALLTRELAVRLVVAAKKYSRSNVEREG